MVMDVGGQLGCCNASKETPSALTKFQPVSKFVFIMYTDLTILLTTWISYNFDKNMRHYKKL